MLVLWATQQGLINDISVNTGDIDDSLSSETIRIKIRDEYLRDSSVTILLCGEETRFRKHVDWELKSSMINGPINKRSGILVIDLPTSSSPSWYTSFHGEAELIYPDYQGEWNTQMTLADFEAAYPDMPRRILQNLAKPGVLISVAPWDRVYGYAERFSFLLQNTAEAGPSNEYDLSRPMRRKNFNPRLDYFDPRV